MAGYTADTLNGTLPLGFDVSNALRVVSPISLPEAEVSASRVVGAPGNAKVATFTDDFGAGINPGIWNAAAATVSDGLVTLNINSGVYGQIDTNAKLSFDLASSSVFMQWVSLPTFGASNECFLEMINNASNKFSVFRSGALNPVTLRTTVGGTATSVNASNTNPWWRLRESGGNVYLDTSADGNTWVQLLTKAHTLTAAQLSNMYLSINAGDYGALGAKTAVIDNVNVVPTPNPSISGFTENFTTLDPAIWAHANANPIAGQLTFSVSTAGVASASTLGHRRFDMAGGSLSLQWVSTAMVAGITYDVGMWFDANNYVRAVKNDINTQIVLEQRIGGVLDPTGVTNSDPWWRIRESAGTFYLDTSSDGLDWTQLATRPHTFTASQLGNMYIYLEAVDFDSNTSRNFVADNLNLYPAPTGQPKIRIGSAWQRKPVKVWNGSTWVQKPVKVWTGTAWKTVT